MKQWAAFGGILAAALLVWLVASRAAEPPALQGELVHLAGEVIAVDVADDPAERERGLSGRAGLSANEGMLFVFPEDGQHGFWMKDMRFAIDILWLAADGTIVHLEESVAPESYPRVFTPSAAARMVLELPAGWAAGHGVRVGDIVRR